MIARAYELSLMQDFPYYVEQGIAHDNIWSTTPLTTDELVEVSAALQVIENKLGATRKYTYFINPGPLASIPGVSLNIKQMQ